MKRLLDTYAPGCTATTRRAIAHSFVAACPCTLLLKGARTFITDGTHSCYNSTGGPYMACGGQGDVLAGVIAALAAQGLEPYQAAATGAYTCGLAAATAWRALGCPPSVRPTQLLPFVSKLL